MKVWQVATILTLQRLQILNGQVHRVLENLSSRKKQWINYPLNPERPSDTYYDSLQLTKKNLTIWTDGKTRSFMLNI
jgi:hypothetical protein